MENDENEDDEYENIIEDDEVINNIFQIEAEAKIK